MDKALDTRSTQFALSALGTASLLTFLLMFPLQTHADQITQQLSLGMENADVTSLQTFLAGDSTLYPSGIISGYFGSLTAAAVSRYQSANGLAAVGRVGPQTLSLINSQMGGTGSSGGADLSAPIMSTETVSMASTSGNIIWTTSEPANDRIMYGTTWPFLYATAPSVSGTGLSSTGNITISGLQSHTTYYYVRESIDLSGNVMWTIGKPMTTL
jgi:peptidoglycan hydrolase-like protein with peptidoglycan-binding domain